jgi:hypothetical protein
MTGVHLTIRRLFFILLFLGLFLMTLRPVVDPDFWWHLRTGQLIAQTHAIPHSDPFSFTNTGKPWVAHEWLSEILMYRLYLLGSFGLLIFTFSVVITTAFLLTYLRCPLKSRPYVAGFVLLLGAIATAPTWGVRPQMISLFLFSLLLYLLDRYTLKADLKFIIPIPALTLIWVNLHASYFLGLVVVAIYIVGGLIDSLRAGNHKNQTPESSSLKSILALCSVLGISILLTLVNPNGIHIILYPFQTLTSHAMQEFIQEWSSPDFHLLEWQPLAWFILALIGAGMLGRKSISLTKVLLVLGFGYAALHSMRHVPLFIVIAIPILADQIGVSDIIHSESNTTGQLRTWLAPILLSISILAVGLRFAQVVQSQAKSEANYFPKDAIGWIQNNHPPGNLFNSYGCGGYIIWRLYPRYLVYIDGRADVYGDNFIYSFLNISRGFPGWDQALSDQAVNLVLVESTSGLATVLRDSSGWEIEYEDPISIIFERK